ncbi:hypothetical protein BOX15_Mlig007083g1, partial [Macrostomum lignano]
RAVMLSRTSLALLRAGTRLGHQASMPAVRANSNFYWATPPRNRVSVGTKVGMGVSLYLVWFLPLCAFLQICKNYRTEGEDAE